MKAIRLTGAGGPEFLSYEDVAEPQPSAGEVLIAVTTAGVNRADLLQRQGHYPPPPGASELPGLEVSGTIAELGPGLDGSWQVGDEVCALLTGGGYAEYVAVPAGQLLPIPDGIDLADAATFPEVTCTVWSNIWQTANLQPGETLLIHGGASGIGTMGIQLASAFGSRVAVTAGSEEKLVVCRDLGAEITVNYRQDDFVDEVQAQTDGHGADVILDVIGAKYLERNVRTLATGGRLVVIGLQGGIKAELNLGQLLRKRASVHATSLRARPVSDKAQIVAAVREHVWPLIASGQVRAVIDARYRLEEASLAHEHLDRGTHIGKVLLDVS